MERREMQEPSCAFREAAVLSEFGTARLYEPQQPPPVPQQPSSPSQQPGSFNSQRIFITSFHPKS